MSALAPTLALLWAGGATTAFHLSYSVPGCGSSILFYLFCLVQLARLGTTRQAFYFGLGTGLLCVAPHLTCFWVIFGPTAIVLWLILAFWIGLFVALARLCFVRFRPVRAAILIPFLWTGLEYFRSELYYLRFSWLNVGYTLADSWMRPLLHWAGMYGAGFLAMGVAMAVLLCFSQWRACKLGPPDFTARIAALEENKWPNSSPSPPPSPGRGRIAARPSANRGTWFSTASGVLRLVNPPAVFLFLLIVCLLLSISRTPLSAGKDVPLAGAQLEFPIPTEVISTLDSLLVANPSTQMFVLSEYTFDGSVPENIKGWCREHRRYLIAGGKDDAPNGNFYNTAFVIGPMGEIVFRQAKRVPIQFFKDGLPAPEQKLWDSPWGKIGICICYDLSYTRVTDQLIRLGAQAIIVPTMDVADWGRRQHELHARVAPVRAAEYGVPIFRLASSGFSQCVDRSGKVTAIAPFPGPGATLSGSLTLGNPGSLLADRWLAPFATGLVAAIVVWLVIRRGKGRQQAEEMTKTK